MDRSLRGLINNKNGALFESEIIGGCIGVIAINVY